MRSKGETFLHAKLSAVLQPWEGKKRLFEARWRPQWFWGCYGGDQPGFTVICCLIISLSVRFSVFFL